MPGSARSVSVTARGLRRGRHHLQRAGRARAEGALHLLVALAGAVVLGHDGDRRHAGVELRHREGERADHEEPGDGEASGASTAFRPEARREER